MSTSQGRFWPGHSSNKPQLTGGGSSNSKSKEDDQPPADSPPIWDPLRLRPSDTSVGTIQSQVVPQEAPIPSPLATLGSRQTELTNIVDGMAVSVRDLWNLCAHDDCPIRGEIPQGRPGKKANQSISDNTVGFVAWIGRGSAQESDRMEGSDDEFGDDEGPPATNEIRYKWITRRSKVILGYPGSSHGIVPTDNETLNINFSQTTDGVSGHFITHSSQSPLTINGIRVPTRTIAGPLPLFAVIEIGDLAAFWWGDSEGLHYLPRRPTTPTKGARKRSSVGPEDELDNFHDDDVPLAKRTKLLAAPSRLGPLRRSARIASRLSANSGGRTDSSGTALDNSTRRKIRPSRAPRNTASGRHPFSRTPRNTEVGHRQGPPPSAPPKTPPLVPKTDRKPGSQPPPIEKPGSNPPPIEKPREDTRYVPPSNSPKTWNQQLQQRLRFWRSERKRASSSNEGGDSFGQASADAPYQIPHPENLDDDSVFLGIASVWRPLIDWGTNFAFGNQNHFQTARVEDPNFETDSVLSPHPLIIPLIFNREVNSPLGEGVNDVKPPRKRPAKEPAKGTSSSEGAKDKQKEEVPEQKKSDKGKQAEIPAKPKPKPHGVGWRGGIGHFVLAVAERIPHTHDRVRLRFWDSSRGSVSENVIRASARNIVRNSSWMPPDVWPRFEETWSFSPSQTGNTCGSHVLLNAWAYMLNIPVNTNKKIRGSFYQPALEIINLALRGLMDATTIRAFLQVNGYAAPQDFLQVQQQEASTRPYEARQMRNLPRTARINGNIFNGDIAGIAFLEAKQASAQEAQEPPNQESESQTPPKSPNSKGPTDKTPQPQGSKSPKYKSPKGKSPNSANPPKDHTSPRDRSPPKDRPSAKHGSSPKSRKTPKARSPSQDRSSSTIPPHGKKTSPKARTSPRQGTNTSLQKTSSPPVQYTWEQILENGLRQQRTAAKNSNKTATYSLSTVASNALDDLDVGYAIASVWAGLRNSKSYFGFGSPTTFMLYRKDPEGLNVGDTAVGGPNHLIMPLAFHSVGAVERELRNLSKSAAQGKTVKLPPGSTIGGIGHFILAVARRQGRASSDTVALYILDSAPGVVSQFDLAATAQNIVRHSGWMGVNFSGVPLKVTPNFTAPSTQNVPRQKGINNCGFHVILNAWAFMLGIHIVSSETRMESTWRGGPTSDAEFYRLGKEIMNLAIRGFMDSTTIQAFMTVFGYARYRPPGVARNAATLMNSVEMDGQILQTILQTIRNEEADGAARR